MFEYASRLCRRKAPVDSGLCRIATRFPGGDLAANRLLVSEASVHALAHHHRAPDFGHLEPAAVFGGVMNIQLPPDTARFCWRKRSIPCGRGVRVQMGQHHTDHGRLRNMDSHPVAHPVSNVLGGAPVGDLDLPPAWPRLKAHAQVADALPTIVVVIPHGLPWGDGSGLAPFAHQWIGACLATHQRIKGIVGLGRPVEEVLQAPHTLRAHTGNTPGLLLPWREDVFLSGRRTVSSAMASTTWTSTSISASHGIVQHARPSGGVLHTRAMRKASGLPSNLRWPPGQGRARKAASRPSSTKRLRIRSTVAVPTWRVRAIASSARSASSRSNRWARVHRRAETLPRFVRATNGACSSSVRVTRYFLAMAPSCFCRTIHEKSHGINIAVVVH
jgi:hypothetical protein